MLNKREYFQAVVDSPSITASTRELLRLLVEDKRGRNDEIIPEVEGLMDRLHITRSAVYARLSSAVAAGFLQPLRRDGRRLVYRMTLPTEALAAKATDSEADLASRVGELESTIAALVERMGARVAR